MTGISREISELRAHVAKWRTDSESIGLVPTMGALHAGHMALVRAAKGMCDRVVATIFVNPTQFAAGEDLDLYPNTFDADMTLLRNAGVDQVFVPQKAVIYPQGFATNVTVSGLSDVLCGASRPGHFDGVTQVVAKLLNIVDADQAFFGEKDWQQLVLVRRMAADLNFTTDIVNIPTIRADDGLALSSRNAYLSEAERAVAPALYLALLEAAHDIRSGMAASGACAKAAEAVLEAGFRQIDYLECRDSKSLMPKDHPTDPVRVFGAAYLGAARLIDNVPV